ncbi:MAG: GNAT family N-acetyltransferase [Marinilabiliaceae bacterium]|nr:GNAT family N-acetyltransferase [Marinilabiliaceae bacterium]
MTLIQPVLPPVPRNKIEAELTKEIFVRNTNKGNNKIYDFSAAEAPNLMIEVGRLRELTFRAAGGGTGKNFDIDEFDNSIIPYRQLIVWDPITKEILGGYRYIMGNKLRPVEEEISLLATAQLFSFSKEFITDYLPFTIELGRSFVQPMYQSSKLGSKSLFALDNLWDGLGSLIVNYPEMKYFFGKVTMYSNFNQEARDIIRIFMDIYFSDPKRLVYPIEPVVSVMNENDVRQLFSGNSFSEDYKILSKKVRDLGENIPPLFNAYMSLSPTMKTFGTSVNKHFGGVEETGIILTIKELYEAKVQRHITTYKKNDLHE